MRCAEAAYALLPSIMTTFISPRPVQPCIRFSQFRPHRTSDCDAPTRDSRGSTFNCPITCGTTATSSHSGCCNQGCNMWQFGASAVALHATGKLGKPRTLASQTRRHTIDHIDTSIVSVGRYGCYGHVDRHPSLFFGMKTCSIWIFHGLPTCLVADKGLIMVGHTM